MKLCILIILSIAVVILSIVFDVVEFLDKEHHWFQRSGSLLVLFGALFESKYILRSSIDGENVIGGGFAIDGKIEPKENNASLLSDIKKIKTHAGFYIILLGTVIWGYGDLAKPLYT